MPHPPVASRPRPIALAPARLDFTAQGIPASPDYGDVYHSADGGAAQARHVFLGGNGLPGRWRRRRSFTIVETGFGLGLNFLETWRAWEDDPDRPAELHFVSVEAHPLAAEDFARVHAARPEHAARARALAAVWPLPLAGFHRLHFASGSSTVTLTLLLGDAAALLPQLTAHADALYLDGFAPDRNPALWSPQVFQALAALCAPGATLATWSVAAAVRDGLAAAGFHVEKRAGFGSKRDMLAGEYRGAGNFTPPYPRHRRAMVIGAGLAGTACAECLAARGWEVTVIERAAMPGSGASGNALGLAAPLLNLADGANARFSRAAFLYARHHYAALSATTEAAGMHLTAQGVLRVARNERDATRFQRLLEELQVPAELASYADSAEGARRAGRAVSRPGLWLPGGFTLAPPGVCAAQLAARAARIRTLFGAEVAGLQSLGENWRATSADGAVLAEAPVVIFACAMDTLRFAAARALRLEAIRGQVTLLPADTARRLDVPVTGEAHALPLPDGDMMIGASFQPGDEDGGVRIADHTANMARIEAQLPGLCTGLDPASLQGRAAFRTVTPDRLPVFGALAEAGLYVATGLGARGLVWAPLGAELIAAQIEGQPWPVGRELADAVAPGRFGSDANKPRVAEDN